MKNSTYKVITTIIVFVGFVASFTSCTNQESLPYDSFESSDLISSEYSNTKDQSLFFSVYTKDDITVQDTDNVYVITFKNNKFDDYYKANLVALNKYKVDFPDCNISNLQVLINPSEELLENINIYSQDIQEASDIKTNKNLYTSAKIEIPTEPDTTSKKIEIFDATTLNTKVKDWNVVKINYTFKKSTAKPSFTIKNETTGEEKTNPTIFNISKTQNNLIINVTTKGVESKLLNTNNSDGCTITEQSKTVGQGNIYQTFIIHIENNTNKILKFKLSNGFYKDINREFSINQE